MKTKVKRNMKFFTVNKYVRIGLIIINIAIIIVMVSSLNGMLNKENISEEKQKVYSYAQNGTVDYRVYLLPNALYTQKSLGSGNTYINDFLDYINTSFKYDFNGERPADIKGQYEVVAVLEGLLGNESGSKTIWKRSFVLQPKTAFKSNGRTVSLKKDIATKPQNYNKFVEDINKASGVNFDTRLTIFWNVTLQAKTDKGVINETLSPTMEIPLNSKFFEIKGNLSQQKEGAIEEIVKISVPINQKMIVVTCIAIGIFIITLILLLFFIGNKVATSAFDKELKRIFKLHGDRLAELNNEVEVECQNLMRVLSIEALVRIGDEIGRPILFKKEEVGHIIYTFYIIEENAAYVFKLEESLSELISMSQEVLEGPNMNI